jgi:hypothetical protein
MHESLLSAWEAFYLIVGTAAAALTGLQFVVMALISETGHAEARKDSVSAFGSPTVVHFCAALLASAILTAPWDSMHHAGVAVSGCGMLGLIYSAVVLRRTIRQGGYQPVAEDWVWHVILPAVTYAVLLVGGVTLDHAPYGSLFFIGGASLMLVFIGIHNAWDTVMYITVEPRPSTAAREEPRAGRSPLPPGPGSDASSAGTPSA